MSVLNKDMNFLNLSGRMIVFNQEVWRSSRGPDQRGTGEGLQALSAARAGL